MRNSIRQWAKRLGKTSVIALAVGVNIANAQEIGVTATEILLG